MWFFDLRSAAQILFLSSTTGLVICSMLQADDWLWMILSSFLLGICLSFVTVFYHKLARGHAAFTKSFYVYTTWAMLGTVGVYGGLKASLLAQAEAPKLSIAPVPVVAVEMAEKSLLNPSPPKPLAPVFPQKNRVKKQQAKKHLPKPAALTKPTTPLGFSGKVVRPVPTPSFILKAEPSQTHHP